MWYHTSWPRDNCADTRSRRNTVLAKGVAKCNFRTQSCTVQRYDELDPGVLEVVCSRRDAVCQLRTSQMKTADNLIIHSD